ncbi:hypothetical protein [Serratia marcescens]|uniref:hypothetical protein n=1 Tax=Serratia marcescens TaxID=615 RepID=UPI000D8ABBC3|nr:hypothetical protein [Serratia marcescens]PYA07285.1 hypothetical protein DMW43_08055 [Serratia marcescens]
MRITLSDDDPGRKVDLRVERYRVFLDGKEMKMVITADDVKGEVVYCPLDESGYLIRDGDEVKNVTAYGRVEIQFRFPSPIPREDPPDE